MSEIKLLPCPFCGGEAYTYTATSVTNGEKTKVWQVHCKDCRLNYPLNIKCLTEEEAIKKWNTRKPMERIIERLEKIINRTKKEEKQNNDVVDTAMRCSYEHSMKIVKEEGGIE